MSRYTITEWPLGINNTEIGQQILMSSYDSLPQAIEHARDSLVFYRTEALEVTGSEALDKVYDEAARRLGAYYASQPLGDSVWRLDGRVETIILERNQHE